MKAMIEELWQKNRSINSDAFEESLEYINNRVPLEVHRISAGAICNTWPIPKRWRLRDAYVMAEGEKIIDIDHNVLHVMDGSCGVDAVVPAEVFLNRLYYSSENPSAIPYKKVANDTDWGFCVTKQQADSILGYKTYYVKIDAEYTDEDLLIGEYEITGQVPECVVFTASLSNPGQVQSGLSGCAVLVKAIEELNLIIETGGLSLYYTYKFLFVPEIIGSVAYLSTFPSNIMKMKFGCCVDMAGVPNNPIVLQTSKLIDSSVNKVFKVAVKDITGQYDEFEDIAFLAATSGEEKIYNAPSIDIPMVSLSRTANRNGVYSSNHFAGHHTSKDDNTNIDWDFMTSMVGVVLQAIYVLEGNLQISKTYIGIPYLEDPQLIYTEQLTKRQRFKLDVLSQCLEDKNTIVEITEFLNMPFKDVRFIMRRLQEIGYLELSRVDTNED